MKPCNTLAAPDLVLIQTRPENAVLLQWVLEYAGKPIKPPTFSQSVGSLSSKMTALDSTAAMNM